MTDPDRPVREADAAFMRRALELARRGWGWTAPNPMVGAVVVRDGEIVGEGWHAQWGALHAEPVALRAAGERARGATLYVTLEPCTHQGKTPPCTDAILAAGIARVVIAAHDPNPQAAGGARLLRDAGIEVTDGVELAPALELNAPFFFSFVSDRPWMTLKLATSIDGAIAGGPGAPRWLTGPAARAEVHELRANSDAVAVGIGTALADDPLLTVREARAPRVPPLRIVFDSRARLPLGSALVRTVDEGPVVVVATMGEAGRVAALRARGVEVLETPTMRHALQALRARGVRSLLVEGGAGIATSLLEGSLVDRLIIFQAPLVLGAGALPAFASLPGGIHGHDRLRIVERRAVADDLMTIYALRAE